MFTDLYIKPSHDFCSVKKSLIHKRGFYKDTITTLYYSSPVFKEYMEKNSYNATLDGHRVNLIKPFQVRHNAMTLARPVLTLNTDLTNLTPAYMSPETKFVGTGLEFLPIWSFNPYPYDEYSSSLPKNLALLQYDITPNYLPPEFGTFLSKHLTGLKGKNYNLNTLFYYFLILNCETKQESHNFVLFKYVPNPVRENLIKQALDLYTIYFSFRGTQLVSDNKNFIKSLQRYITYKMFSLCINYLPTEEVYSLTKSFRHLWTLNAENLLLIDKSLTKLVDQVEKYKLYNKDKVIQAIDQTEPLIEELLVSLDESESTISDNLLRPIPQGYSDLT